MTTPPAHELETVRYHPDELATYHRNPRRGDIDAIARSLEVNGQYRPIVVNLGRKTGRPLEVLAGNHTLQAAQKLGWTQIVATTIDVTDTEAARIVAADNRTADLGDYDTDTLTALLRDLDDLDGTGYTDDDLTDLLNDLNEMDGSTDHHAEEVGTEIALADVTWGEPKTETHQGETWHLDAGPHHHILVIAKLADEHDQWAHHLTGRRFNPYPDPYITTGEKARTTPLLLVQPNTFLAGQLLDKHASVFGPDSIKKA